jgi:hypothetical protein
MTKNRLKKYANLIARCGVNVQKGQEVYITAELDQPEFVQMVVDECYKAGAKKVTVDFSYGPLTRSHVKYCKPDVLGTLDKWQIERWEHQVEVLPCKIYLISEDPDELEGIDQQKFAKAMAMRSKTILSGRPCCCASSAVSQSSWFSASLQPLLLLVLENACSIQSPPIALMIQSMRFMCAEYTQNPDLTQVFHLSCHRDSDGIIPKYMCAPADLYPADRITTRPEM